MLDYVGLQIGDLLSQWRSRRLRQTTAGQPTTNRD